MVPIGHLVSLTFQQSAHALGQEENQENNFNHFWIHVFKAYKEFDKQIHVENCEELVAYHILCSHNNLVGIKI